MNPSPPTTAPALALPSTGETFRFLASARGSTGRFAFRWHLAPGKVGPSAHRHMDASEHFHVRAGRLDVYMEGRRHALGPGDELTVPKGVLHWFGHPGAEEAVVDVSLDSPGMEDLLVPLGMRYPGEQGVPATGLPTLFAHMADSMARGASVPGSAVERGAIHALAVLSKIVGARPLPPALGWEEA